MQLCLENTNRLTCSIYSRLKTASQHFAQKYAVLCLALAVDSHPAVQRGMTPRASAVVESSCSGVRRQSEWCPRELRNSRRRQRGGASRNGGASGAYASIEVRAGAVAPFLSAKRAGKRGKVPAQASKLAQALLWRSWNLKGRERGQASGEACSCADGASGEEQ